LRRSITTCASKVEPLERDSGDALSAAVVRPPTAGGKEKVIFVFALAEPKML
jgi:hypothetical protein